MRKHSKPESNNKIAQSIFMEFASILEDMLDVSINNNGILCEADIQKSIDPILEHHKAEFLGRIPQEADGRLFTCGFGLKDSSYIITLGPGFAASEGSFTLPYLLHELELGINKEILGAKPLFASVFVFERTDEGSYNRIHNN